MGGGGDAEDHLFEDSLKIYDDSDAYGSEDDGRDEAAR